MLLLDSSACRKLLTQSLPGEAAHSIMAPSTRQEDMCRLDRDKAKNSSVLILLFQKEGTTSFPLIKRPEYNGSHSGQICLPGGKTEPADLSPLHTAIRETEEELGIDRSSVEILGSLSPIYIPVSNFNVQPFIGWWHHPSDYRPDTREVEKVLEMPLRHLIEQDNNHTFTLKANDREIVAPYYDIDNNIIWGATAMILSELKQMIISGRNLLL